jgi:hypothetical protein
MRIAIVIGILSGCLHGKQEIGNLSEIRSNNSRTTKYDVVDQLFHVSRAWPRGKSLFSSCSFFTAATKKSTPSVRSANYV